MVLILFDSYKQNISYDRANSKKVGDFYALTWLIFTGPVTFMGVHAHSKHWRWKVTKSGRAT